MKKFILLFFLLLLSSCLMYKNLDKKTNLITLSSGNYFNNSAVFTVYEYNFYTRIDKKKTNDFVYLNVSIPLGSEIYSAKDFLGNALELSNNKIKVKNKAYDFTSEEKVSIKIPLDILKDYSNLKEKNLKITMKGKISRELILKTKFIKKYKEQIYKYFKNNKIEILHPRIEKEEKNAEIKKIKKE